MKLLTPAVTGRISEAFVAGTGSVDVSSFLDTAGREIDVSIARACAAQAIEVFDGAPPADSDGWLAPRLHASLRLTRREAGLLGFWRHLAIVDCPEYVRWRWPGAGERFTGSDVKQAFSRLWWGAEMFRTGADYAPVFDAFKPQDIPNTIFRLKAAHSRVFCAALLRFVVQRRSDGERLTGRQVNRLSTAVNSQLFVASLDVAAPDMPADTQARDAWLEENVDEARVIAGTASGPADIADEQFETRIQAALELLGRFADGAGIATAENPKAGSKRPGDVDPDES